MSTMPSQPHSSLKLQGYRKRQAASRLRSLHQTVSLPHNTKTSTNSIKIVCISDTHNTHPTLPTGDLLIYAGDLTENGSFDEVQAQLSWLARQPHKYKILIAGNHDVLLDESFLQRYPERRYGQSKDDLDWGDVIYLQDTSTTLTFSFADQQASQYHRSLTIFGSPWTPQYGISAFQFRPDNNDHWTGKLGATTLGTDIIVTHGPPKHHLDARDFYRAGCPYLAEEIHRIKPRLMVFGHIHASYGREEVVLDSVQQAYEQVMTGWGGWPTIYYMCLSILWSKVSRLWKSPGRATIFVNASVVGGPNNELIHEPIVVEVDIG